MVLSLNNVPNTLIISISALGLSKAIQVVQFRPIILNVSFNENSSVMHTGFDIPYQISQEKSSRIKFPCNTLRNKSHDKSGMENRNGVGSKNE